MSVPCLEVGTARTPGGPLPTAGHGLSPSHWRADYPLILKLIGETATTTGLTVKGHLISKNFPTGVEISDEQMRQLRLRKSRVLPQWSYTLLPRQNPN